VIFTSLHRSDHLLHRIRTLITTTAALSVYLGPSVSAIFLIPYISVRLLFAQKVWAAQFYWTRTYPLINDDDGDTVFIANNCSLVKSVCGGGWCFIVALLFRSVGRTTIDAGSGDSSCAASRRDVHSASRNIVFVSIADRISTQ